MKLYVISEFVYVFLCIVVMLYWVVHSVMHVEFYLEIQFEFLNATIFVKKFKYDFISVSKINKTGIFRISKINKTGILKIIFRYDQSVWFIFD